MDVGYNRNRGNLAVRIMSKKATSKMTHAQLVTENKPKPVFYRGTEGKRLARPCMRCGVVVQGTLSDLERHVMTHTAEIAKGYDYTNQAWVVGGVYARCGHQEEHGCTCYGRIHEGEPPMEGASIH